jgi:dihydrofolate reductase
MALPSIRQEYSIHAFQENEGKLIKMRKLIVSLNQTLDGYISGPGGSLNWHLKYWNEEMAKCAGEQLSRAGTILFGRVTYSAMAGYWPERLTHIQCTDPDIAFAGMINQREKIVFSSTLPFTNWNNARIARCPPRIEVNALKQQAGDDILVYGSPTLVSQLFQLHLVDEYVCWIHPVLLGNGLPFCELTKESMVLQLCETQSFATGVMMLRYAVL